MSLHRFVVTASTDPVPGDLHTPESLAQAIATILKAALPSYVTSVEFLNMDLYADAGDFHAFYSAISEDDTCACGMAKDHPVHTVSRQTW